METSPILRFLKALLPNKEFSQEDIENATNYLDPTRELTTAEEKIAKKLLISQFPERVLKNEDPPRPGQKVTSYSFLHLKTPVKLKDGTMVSTFVKCRGTFESDTEAERDATKIIRTFDSKNRIYHGLTGYWYPVVNSLLAASETLDVTDKQGERSLHDEIARQKDEEVRATRRELEEKIDEAKKSDIYDDPTSLRFYSNKRVTEYRLRQEIDVRDQQLNEYKASLLKTRKILLDLERSHPNYRSQWVNCYNEERSKTKLANYVPSESEISEYEKAMEELSKDSKSEQ